MFRCAQQDSLYSEVICFRLKQIKYSGTTVYFRFDAFVIASAREAIQIAAFSLDCFAVARNDDSFI